MENLKLEATLWLKCGFYNLHNPDYLHLWLQSRLYGLCGLFKPQITQIEATFHYQGKFPKAEGGSERGDPKFFEKIGGETYLGGNCDLGISKLLS